MDTYFLDRYPRDILLHETGDFVYLHFSIHDRPSTP